MARESAKKILINGNNKKEELRVALVERGKLFSLDIETKGKEQKKSNIYKATISRIEPSLEAVFVNWGSDRHGFLPFREIAKSYANSPTPIDFSRQNIKDYIFEGQEIIIQVDKEERGTKGAALTTFLTLAGCYLVLMPNNPRAGGISKRIEGDERAELREALSALNVPEGMGVIIRTAGVGKSIEELQWDLNVLLAQYEAINNAANAKTAPFLIFQEGNAVIRAIRDYLKPDVDEIIIDDKDMYNDVYTHIQMIRPEFTDRIKYYNDKIPLFSRYQIESQIETAFKREIQLPAGGAIVIDHTEALISIDINSAKATKGLDIEETALQTNMEAAEEIARQLRLRDLGGLIVIDFIDMNVTNNQRAVENTLRDALSLDKAKVQIGRISRFGLLEMSRQRLRPTLAESNQISCPRCSGHGTIHSIETLAVIVSRVIEEEAIKENTAQIYIEAPLDLSAYLINEKRGTINGIEAKHGVKIILIPNPNLSTPQYQVKRVKHDEIQKQSQETQIATYNLVPAKEIVDEKAFFAEEIEKTPAAAVQFTMTDNPPPPPAKKFETKEARADAKDESTAGKTKSTSIIKKIWSSLIGDSSNSSNSNEKLEEQEKDFDAQPKFSKSSSGYNQDRYQPRHKKRYSSQDRGNNRHYDNRSSGGSSRRDDTRPQRDDRSLRDDRYNRDNRDNREENRIPRDDNRYGRDNGNNRDVNHNRDMSHIRDSSHSRDSSYNRDDHRNINMRDDNRPLLHDNRNARDDNRRTRDDSRRVRDDNRRTRDGSRRVQGDNFSHDRQETFVENEHQSHQVTGHQIPSHQVPNHPEHFEERVERNDKLGGHGHHHIEEQDGGFTGNRHSQHQSHHHQQQHQSQQHQHQPHEQHIGHTTHGPHIPNAPGNIHHHGHAGHGGHGGHSSGRHQEQRSQHPQHKGYNQRGQKRHHHGQQRHNPNSPNHPNNPNNQNNKQKDEPIEINLS